MKVRNLIKKIRWYLFINFGVPKNIGEHISKRYIKKFLPSNPVIIDCGAHYGGDSITWVKIANATVHAFEPSPQIYNLLTQNVSRIEEIKCYPIALSNINGKAKFFISEGESDGSSSLLSPKEHLNDHPNVIFNKTIEVDTITLDSWAERYKIKKVDMLWLDMQGFEMQMLMASDTILDTIQVIHTEVSMKNTYDGVILYPELKKWLESKSFTVKLECIPEGYDFGNVLFIKNKI
jgi:FkbM family methyltransferase